MRVAQRAPAVPAAPVLLTVAGAQNKISQLLETRWGLHSVPVPTLMALGPH